MRYMTVFAALLFLAQQAEGTEIVFSVLCGLYVVLFGLAFNQSGGFSYPSGAFILFNGVLTCLIAFCYKLVINEPGESGLYSPVRTMTLYCMMMIALGVAAGFSRRFRRRTPILPNLPPNATMKNAAIGCFAFGLFLQFIAGRSTEEGSVGSAIAQLNHFIQMAILLATTYEIRSSGGKRSTNWIVLTAGFWIFGFGVIGFSKEGMLLPFLSWLIPCITLRFRFSYFQIALAGGFLYLMTSVLVPYSQVGRKARTYDTSISESVALAIPFLINIDETRKTAAEEALLEQDSGTPHYYSSPQGLFDRLQMIAIDDALISYTDQGNVEGLFPTYVALVNALPHFLYPDKPFFASGNEYGRQLHILVDQDTTTGISFSPLADAYHQAQWKGVVFLLPAVMCLTFLIMDSLSGSVRTAPWGLLFLALESHIAPEGLLGGSIYLATYGSYAVILTAYVTRYFMPLFSRLITGGDRVRVERTQNFRLGVVAPRSLEPPVRVSEGPQ